MKLCFRKETKESEKREGNNIQPRSAEKTFSRNTRRAENDEMFLLKNQ